MNAVKSEVAPEIAPPREVHSTRGNWIGHRRGITALPKSGMFISALLLICGICLQDRRWIVAAFTAALGILGLCEASFWTLAVDLGKRSGGTAAAIMNTGGNGIGLLAPMITPWLASRLGWQSGIGLGALVGLLGGVCWFFIRPDSPAIEQHSTLNGSDGPAHALA